ncbi:MAG: HTTM domain-containing protein [Bacteroidota bacterium]
MNLRIQTYLQSNVKAAPLAVFRVFFGILMLVSIARFWYHGWIESLYLEPAFHFSYYGFEWVKPLGDWTYLLFVLCALSALMVAIGYKYRWAIVVFFLSFTYIELMDKTTYLNHYYFISVLSFLLIFLPANVYFSVDALRARKKGDHVYFGSQVPRWTVDSIKLLLAIVYLYAGLAKLNSDWLVDAMPLSIWLPSKFDIPLLGGLMGERWVHYAFSYFGAGYDLMIPFLLYFKRTRWVAFGLVVVFHVLTRVLFPIGMFPYIMIVATLIFFEPEFHEKVCRVLGRMVRYPQRLLQASLQQKKQRTTSGFKWSLVVVAFLLAVQLLLPWRYLLYPGELFWTEEGYRFSWRVMLMEKTGYAQFKIVDGTTGKWFYVDNRDFLTPFQEKQMSFQPDFILEYAHYLRNHFEKQGHKQVEVYADVKVALNGRLSTTFVDPTVDLASEKESFTPKHWITPFNDEIKGL